MIYLLAIALLCTGIMIAAQPSGPAELLAFLLLLPLLVVVCMLYGGSVR